MATNNLRDIRGLRQQERVVWQRLQERHPEKVQRPTHIDPQDVHRRIGIAGIPPRPTGYLRYYPQDFIVEEITTDGTIATIEPSGPVRPLSEQDKTIYVDVVKIGMGTLEAMQQLVHTLNIPPKQIGYAGIKDTRAVTSQRISIRKAAWQKLLTAPPSQLYVKPYATGKGILTIGQLRGNRFTITVRTPEPIEETWLDNEIAQLAENGFANFYGAQRFGNRQLNPRLGQLLCQGKPAEAIKVFLTQPGPYDLPILQEIRALAACWYGDWAAMQKIFMTMPYTFYTELGIIQSLRERPKEWHAALLSVADQARFWIYGYVAHLVNRLLSQAFTAEAAIPDPLPIPLDSPAHDEVYRDLLEADGTTDYYRHVRVYPFLQQRARMMDPWIMPEIHHTRAVPAGAIVSFSLPKGVYATTFLMFLFRLYEGAPVPEWVKSNEYDAKELLGTGSVTAALRKLEIPQDILKPR